MTWTNQSPGAITVHVPFRLVKRGGRKEIILPSATAPQRSVFRCCFFYVRR